jgi:hypothetical protein
MLHRKWREHYKEGGGCARCDDDVHQRMNPNGLSQYDFFPETDKQV